MDYVIIILLCLIILILFTVYDKVSTKVSNVKKEDLQNAGFSNQKELEIFRQGLHQGWMHVNISLYKMWSEMDILDFDSIQNKLQQTLENLANNPNELNKWYEKFKEYLKDYEK